MCTAKRCGAETPGRLTSHSKSLRVRLVVRRWDAAERLRHGPAGFTLIEIMVAIFIFSLIVAMIFGAYSSTFRVVKITRSQSDIYRKARIALERISEDLAAVHISASTPKAEGADSGPGDFVGEDRQVNGHSADFLRFVSRAHLVFTGGNDGFATTVITYEVEEDGSENGLRLQRSDRPQLATAGQDDKGGLTLCDGLQAMEITYQNQDGEILENWDSGDMEMAQHPAASRIPAMVSIQLEFANEAEPEQPLVFMTSVALPVYRAP